MKEATGELSMTAIVVVILGVVAVAAPIIINTVTNTMKLRVACQAAYGCDGTCSATDKTQECYYQPATGESCVGTEDDNGCKITCECDANY